MQDFHSTPVACRTPNPLAEGRQTVWLWFGTFQPRHTSSQPERRPCRAEQQPAAFFLRGVNPTGIHLLTKMSTLNFVAVCAAVASASAAPSKPHILMVIVDVSCSFYTSDAYTWPACRVCVCACVRVNFFQTGETTLVFHSRTLPKRAERHAR